VPEKTHDQKMNISTQLLLTFLKAAIGSRLNIIICNYALLYGEFTTY